MEKPKKKYLPKQTHSTTVLFFLLLASISLYGQHENDWWYFGQYANTQFTDTGLRSDTVLSPIDQMEGVASVAHPISGDLLFYTDGKTIWDEDHSPMPNGMGLSGHNSSTQSAAIVRVPGSKYRYYVFSLADGQITLGRKGLTYSIVDMRLNAGKGDVVPSFRDRLIRTPAGEQMAITKHATLNAFWLVTRGFLNNRFYTYLLSATGITGPIISSAGPHNRAFTTAGAIEIGQMKISVQGDQMVTCHLESGDVTLYDFNNATGVVSNARSNNVKLPYGVEFSPSGKYIYIAANDRIWQMNTGANFARHRPFEVVRQIGVVFTSMQLAKDQRIYLASLLNGNLACIRQPNLGGGACDFVFNAHNLANFQSCKAGLPNMVNSTLTPHKFEIERNCVNKFMRIEIRNRTFIDSVFIDFGDPGSGSANYSRNPVDSHRYVVPGKYRIMAVVYSEYKKVLFRDTLIDTIEIIDIPKVNLGNDTAFCRGPIFLLHAGNEENDYQWQDGSTLEKYWVKNSGRYWVKATNQCGTGFGQIKVRVDDTLKYILPPDTFFCSKDSIHLRCLIPLDSVIWSTGSTDSSVHLTQAGKYWVKGTNQCNSLIDTITIKEIRFPVNEFSRDTVLCQGDTLEIGSSADATKYHWNTGDTTSSIKVHRTGLYVVRAWNYCGLDVDSIYAYFDFLPQYPMRDTILCNGDWFKAEVEVPYSTKFLWSTGDTSTSTLITEAGNYSITITNVCGQGVESFAVDAREKPKLYLPETLSFCGSDELVVQVGYDNQSWKHYTDVTWSDGYSGYKREIPGAGFYWVSATNQCGQYTDSIEVVEGVQPLISPNHNLEICGEDLVVDFSETAKMVYWDAYDSSLIKTFKETARLWVNYVDINGCKGESEVRIRRCPTPLMVPNAFTPNYDGKNEVFRAFKEGISDFEMQIFDQWGTLIFTSTDIKLGWDGISSTGENCPVGTYVYQISYYDHAFEKKKVHRGEVHLIR